MNGENQKLKLLYLKKIFEERTDEDHGLTMNDLIALLRDYEIIAGNQGLYDDINCLRLFGMAIDYSPSDHTYRLTQKKYSTAEIQVMKDAAVASTAISTESTEAILEKLNSEISTYEQRKSRKIHPISTYRLKTSEPDLLEKLTVIQDAIDGKKGFYCHYNKSDYEGNKQKDSAFERTVFPYALFYLHDEYHLLGFCKIVNLRNDKDIFEVMCFRVEDLSIDMVFPHSRYDWQHVPKIDLNAYLANPFLLGGGKIQSVSLAFDKEAKPQIAEKALVNKDNVKYDGTLYHTTLSVMVNDVFFEWVFSLGEHICIESPVSVRRTYLRKLRSAKKPYKRSGTDENLPQDEE